MESGPDHKTITTRMTDRKTGQSVEAKVTGENPQSSFAASVLSREALLDKQGGIVSDELTSEIVEDGE